MKRHHPGRLKTLGCRHRFSIYGCEANVWIKYGKVGDNIFKPGYHLSNVKNVVITPRKTSHAFVININA
jgi:hypothetical protein